MENRARFKFAKVTETKPGFARVVFADLDNLETEFLPLLFAQTLENRQIHTIDAGSLVAVLMDEHLEDGVILGAVYSSKNPPEQVELTTRKFKAKDGGFISYNSANGELLIETQGLTKIKAAGDLQIETAGNAQIKAAGTLKTESGGQTLITAPKIALEAPLVEISGILAVKGKGAAGNTTGTIHGDVRIVGNVEIEHNLQAGGNINAAGDILAGGRNSNHHSH